MQIFKTLIQEYQKIKPNSTDWVPAKAVYRYLYDLHFQARVLVRLQQNATRYSQKARIARKLMKRFCIEIGCGCSIGENLCIEHPFGIVIGKKACIGQNCVIYQHVTIGKKNEHYPIIGNGVTIYPGATIIGQVRVGDGAVIAPGAVVLNDVQPYSVVGGIPARDLKGPKKK